MNASKRTGGRVRRPETIGLPRALLYHRYGVLWESFLRQIGHEVVVSPESSTPLLEEGCAHAPDEACLPVKLHLGHVAWLLPRCDAVLLPRIVSLGKREENCAKFLGAYDIAANVFPAASLLTYTVDVRNGCGERAGLRALGEALGASPLRAALACERARGRQRAHERAEARAELERLRARDGRPGVLVVAHGYNLADEHVGAPVARMLAAEGLRVVSAEALGIGRRGGRPRLARDVYWTYSRELLGSVERALRAIDGILFLVSFPCGPDSLVTELCRLRIRDVPLTSIVLDEHAADAGLRTRIECFADVVRTHAALKAAPA
ncbi:MAG: hypothetical protein IBX62_01135 [Coriobacteriia bacterium]|nr:hypothetical protein [Coriobacteriia bacterium]